MPTGLFRRRLLPSPILKSYSEPLCSVTTSDERSRWLDRFLSSSGCAELYRLYDLSSVSGAHNSLSSTVINSRVLEGVIRVSLIAAGIVMKAFFNSVRVMLPIGLDSSRSPSKPTLFVCKVRERECSLIKSPVRERGELVPLRPVSVSKECPFFPGLPSPCDAGLDCTGALPGDNLRLLCLLLP